MIRGVHIDHVYMSISFMYVRAHTMPMSFTRRTLAGLKDSSLQPNKLVGALLSWCKFTKWNSSQK